MRARGVQQERYDSDPKMVPEDLGGRVFESGTNPPVVVVKSLESWWKCVDP